jgi:fructose 1,6-bisphosphate aldolase/phosphatase
VVTISAIIADTGGYVGHSVIHPDLAVEAKRRVATAIEEPAPVPA